MTTTTTETTTVPADDDRPCDQADRQLVEVVSGPHTIVALGEDCLVCEEGLEPGQVYVFCRDQTRAGVAHEESCTEPIGPDDTARIQP